ncbi:DUF3107 domain-containing protein [Mycetocola zhujimingii]|uniref:DUF3107 domain-containing protein n=1 Tax=Mycetocola zhujimingii TaxID=2079792 RepID=A0A2U1THP3_9MICO|nr:DUF3107 domain-containing protein [Mycetocola zhujimingii]AWB86863.1 DUF3107 domain-containing protein [Mycetocola zhujimingii]PWC08411.1 DUF3107 domain-containing protein [Mycetocola zhujimingii]
MEIRIGITNSGRELSFESSQSTAEIEKLIADALDSSKSFFTISDDKGKMYIVPTAGLAYVEIGSEETRRIGFVG